MGINLKGFNYNQFQEFKSCGFIPGLMFQIIKWAFLHNIQLRQHPELIHLNKDANNLTGFLKIYPEQLLLIWFNYHLKAANYQQKITNFSEDIKDSKKYTILLNQLNKNICDTGALIENDMIKRAKRVIDNCKLLGIKTYISPNDIVSGNEKLNTIFVASIFNTYSGLPESINKNLDNNSDEYKREERAFRKWINSLELKDNSGEPIYVNDLYEQSKDGIILLLTLDKIKPGIVNWRIVSRIANNPIKELLIAMKSLMLAKEQNILYLT